MRRRRNPPKRRKCGNCGRTGHNSRTCTYSSRSSRSKPTSRRRCGTCGGIGHNARTCTAGRTQQTQQTRQTSHTQSRSRQSSSSESRNLQEIFDNLNDEYFQGRLTCSIRWTTSVITSMWGYYEPGRNRITLNRVYQSPEIPFYCLESTVYHEMVHADVPVYRGANGCRVIHGPEFKRREKLYRHYHESKAWKKANGHYIMDKESGATTIETYEGLRVGQTFVFRGTSFTIINFKPSQWKYPVMVQNARGTVYKMTLAQVKGTPTPPRTSQTHTRRRPRASSSVQSFDGLEVGDTFTVRRTTYTIVGFKASRWKYPVTAEGPRGGKWKFTLAQVKGGRRRNPQGLDPQQLVCEIDYDDPGHQGDVIEEHDTANRRHRRRRNLHRRNPFTCNPELDVCPVDHDDPGHRGDVIEEHDAHRRNPNATELSDQGIYYMGDRSSFIEECSELETINYDPSFWGGPGYYQFDYDNHRAHKIDSPRRRNSKRRKRHYG